MNEHERYLFDLNGYIVIPNALGPDMIASLNAIMDEQIAANVEPDARTHRFHRLLPWGDPYLELIDNPKVSPVLEELNGGSYRLDHEYADIIRSGKGPIGTTLHGGAVPYDFSCYYAFSNGTMRCGLVAVGFNLREVNPGDGGFGCVPGSHKANYPFPMDWLDLETPPSCVTPVTGPAGTAIVFTEALAHGTLPWRASHERRTVFYKFSPAPLSWSRNYYNVDEYPGLTSRQREILQAPSARY